MDTSEIIVVGASAGGVAALEALVAGLPSTLNASVFAVLHIGYGPSQLEAILGRAGSLPAKRAIDGERIEAGCIYTAPPDFHMLLDDGCVRLSHGPKENHTRPAINPLFRSAAQAYGQRVTGVILTGMLDDGVAGLAEIKRKGGIAIVQDPRTALFPSMPENAMTHVDIDYVLPVDAMGELLTRLTEAEHRGAERREHMERKLVQLTCPDCDGPIWEERQGRIVEYRCRIGHVFSPLTMVNGYEEAVEAALWKSVVALEGAADVADQLAADSGSEASEAALKKRQQAAALREMLRSARKNIPDR